MKESNIKLMIYEAVNNISLLEILVYIFLFNRNISRISFRFGTSVQILISFIDEKQATINEM